MKVLVQEKTDRVDLKDLMKALAAEKIDSILIEGGAGIHASVLEAGIVNKVYAYIAGKLVGGKEAPTPIGGTGILKMADAVKLSSMEVERFGEDICISGYVES